MWILRRTDDTIATIDGLQAVPGTMLVSEVHWRMLKKPDETAIRGRSSRSLKNPLRGLPVHRKIMYAAAVIIALTALAEGAGRIILAWNDSRASLRARLPWYAEQDWSATHFRECEQSLFHYEPYVAWRRRDFHGETVNVVNGERVVRTNPAPREGDIDVWCFGGSTMWGTGSRDDHTIAAELGSLIAENAMPCQVRNLAEGGWVSTQSLVWLMLKIRNGEVPDVVVFYDGVNDVGSAYQTGRADGSHQNLPFWEAYVDQGVDPRRHWTRQLALYRITQGLLWRVGLTVSPQKRSAAQALDENQLQQASSGVARVYGDNIAMVQALARLYGFDALFFWQPIVSDQENYTQSEQQVRSHFDPQYFDLYERTRKKVMSAARPPVDLVHCLGPSPPTGFFSDYMHLTEDGNAKVAAAIFEHLRPILVRRSASE